MTDHQQALKALEIARWCGIDAGIQEMACEFGILRHVEIEETGEVFEPRHSLDSCALAYPVLRERGLMDAFVEALRVDLKVFPSYYGFSKVDVWSFIEATPAQITEALLAVIRANPREDQNETNT